MFDNNKSTNRKNKDAINAQLNDGVLEITIPKREELKPKHISISA